MRLGGHSLATALALLASCGAASAQQNTYQKYLDRGGKVSLGFYYNVNPDCSSRGYSTVATLGQPAGGQVLSYHASDYPSFQAPNPRERCNTRRVQGTLVIYRASPDFSGSDTFGIRVVDPNGNAREFNIQANVR